VGGGVSWVSADAFARTSAILGISQLRPDVTSKSAAPMPVRVENSSTVSAMPATTSIDEPTTLATATRRA